ncbi:MAG: recombination protein F [bacterium ADurb.BinA186]|nr:MAG: recombination protein F [bacterium ADurb.BinA186]
MLAIFHVRGTAPIIILDDIVSELDQQKKDNLMTLIAKLGTQAFFSATDVQSFGRQLPCGSLFMVREGNVAKL